jgi:hypothetical protein
MTKYRSLSIAALIALAVPAARLAGQSYGDQFQTLTVGAGAFQVADATDGDGGYIDVDGYLYAPGQPVVWTAPLYLPDGAVIHQVCLFVNDLATDHTETADVVEEELASGGATPFSHNIAGAVSGPGLDGYGYFCSPTTYQRIRNSADANGDGVTNPTTYRIVIHAYSTLGFGGLQIVWQRSVSHPPAAPTFADVPMSDGAFQHIEALVASGITAGCGNDNYCPDATLTRRQMAVFIAKALGLHWVD